jgi:uncharacterized RDD family membrane protein YckC
VSHRAILAPAGLTTDGLLGKRYMARFIDSIIVFLPVLAAFGLAGAIHARSTAEILVQGGVCLIFFVGYGAAFESSPWQATLGKRLMGLRVYTAEGNRLTPFQAAARNLTKEGPFVVFAFIPFGRLLGVVWLCTHLVVVNSSPVYQAIHDRIARTLVAAPEETTRLRLA